MRKPPYWTVCDCTELLDPSDDRVTGTRCRCLEPTASQRTRRCAACVKGLHVDAYGRRLAAESELELRAAGGDR